MNKKVGIICGVIALVVAGIIAGYCLLCDKEADVNKTNITINVYDKDNQNIYNKNVATDKEFLNEALKEQSDLELVTVDSEYGEYITSIKGIEQGDDYYWSYYVGDDYATVGISSCKIEEGQTYNFKIEKFEI